MKFVKGIGLFFVYPLCLLGLGFYAGVCLTHFFYPGERVQREYEEQNSAYEMSMPEEIGYDRRKAGETLEVASSAQTLSVETEYVLVEKDVDGETTVETTWKLPDKYVGMNREQFLEAMELYEAFPPHAELERGFVSLEVISFSRKRVVIQMNYQYVKPGSSFYLMVQDNEVIVYLEDRETVYIETEIMLDTLPVELQYKIIDIMWLEDEEALYDFLETYSS